MSNGRTPRARPSSRARPASHPGLGGLDPQGGVVTRGQRGGAGAARGQASTSPRPAPPPAPPSLLRPVPRPPEPPAAPPGVGLGGVRGRGAGAGGLSGGGGGGAGVGAKQGLAGATVIGSPITPFMRPVTSSVTSAGGGAAGGEALTNGPTPTARSRRGGRPSATDYFGGGAQPAPSGEDTPTERSPPAVGPRVKRARQGPGSPRSQGRTPRDEPGSGNARTAKRPNRRATPPGGGGGRRRPRPSPRGGAFPHWGRLMGMWL